VPVILNSSSVACPGQRSYPELSQAIRRWW